MLVTSLTESTGVTLYLVHGEHAAWCSLQLGVYCLVNPSFGSLRPWRKVTETELSELCARSWNLRRDNTQTLPQSHKPQAFRDETPVGTTQQDTSRGPVLAPLASSSPQVHQASCSLWLRGGDRGVRIHPIS